MEVTHMVSFTAIVAPSNPSGPQLLFQMPLIELYTTIMDLTAARKQHFPPNFHV